jgi:peptidoglycan-N-acetylglucosamine deacetylase
MSFSKICLCLVVALTSFGSVAKEIALSFDDAPRGDTQIFTGVLRTKELLKSLKSAEVDQVVFFCNSIRLGLAGTKRIRSYAEEGHLIANHTHSHPNASETEPGLFWMDTLRADAELKGFTNFRPWLRFPYLREGKTMEHRDSIRSSMKAAGYSNGYATIDNADWYIDDLVQRKKSEGMRIDLEKLKKAYVEVLLDSVEFYDRLALETLKRSPKHILLLHENDLAALFVGDLVKALRKKGWKVISPDEAYKDPLFETEPDTLIMNQGRIASFARAAGYKGSIWSKWEEEADIDRYFDQLGVFVKP